MDPLLHTVTSHFRKGGDEKSVGSVVRWGGGVGRGSLVGWGGEGEWRGEG